MHIVTVNHAVREFQTPYDAYISRFESLLGRHDIQAYSHLLGDPKHAKDVEAILRRQEGSNGLMLFTSYDHGALLSIKGLSRMARQYVIGNPLFAARLTEHDIRAALYAPLRVVVYANESGGTTIEYDLPSSVFGQFQNRTIDEVAVELDRKLLEVVERAAAL